MKPKLSGTNILVKFIPQDTIDIIDEISELTLKTRTFIIRAILNDGAPKALAKLKAKQIKREIK